MRNYKPEGRFYIIMREDLPSLNPGKALAQAAHAQGVAETFFTYIGNEHRKASWIEWKKQGYGGPDCSFAFVIQHPTQDAVQTPHRLVVRLLFAQKAG